MSELDSLGIVLARTATVQGNALQAISLGLQARQRGKEVGVFLISDGVWISLKGAGAVSEKLEELVSAGGKMYISGEHAAAGGLPADRIIEGGQIVEKAYNELVEKVMEEWDKVIIC